MIAHDWGSLLSRLLDSSFVSFQLTGMQRCLSRRMMHADIICYLSRTTTTAALRETHRIKLHHMNRSRGVSLNENVLPRNANEIVVISSCCIVSHQARTQKLWKGIKWTETCFVFRSVWALLSSLPLGRNRCEMALILPRGHWRRKLWLWSSWTPTSLAPSTVDSRELFSLLVVDMLNGYSLFSIKSHGESIL
jgi:hypothetical protein